MNSSQLPAGWKVKKLADSLDEIIDYRGKSTPKDSFGYQLITARNVRFGYIDFSSKEYMNPDDYREWMTRGFPKPGDVLFTTEAPLGNVALYPDEGTYALAQRLVTLRANPKILDSTYLLYYLLSDYGQRQVNLKATGSTAIGIRQSELRKVPIILPPLPEQRKIAEILSTWDEAVAASERLLASLRERKKGLMQRLLTPPSAAGQAGQVRFAGFDGMWREVHLRDVFQRVTRKVGDNRVEYVLSITATIGFVDQREKFGKVIAGKNLGNYVLLQKGEFAYNKGNSNAYPQGCIYLLEEFEEGAVPNVYFSFTAKSTEVVHPHFYKFYFESGALNPQLQKYISSSARADGLFNIAFDDFFSIKIPLPPIKEQEKIAAALESCDGELRTQAKKLKALQQQKKGLMQRLLTGQVRVQV